MKKTMKINAEINPVLSEPDIPVNTGCRGCDSLTSKSCHTRLKHVTRMGGCWIPKGDNVAWIGNESEEGKGGEGEHE